jgi:hypothetical protein
MPTKEIIFDKFAISNPETVGSAVKVFIAFPRQNFKEQLGQLFVLIQTGPNKIYPSKEEVGKTIDFIDAFISFIEKKYYQQPISENLEKYFEKILQEINQWLENNFYATDLGSNILNTSIIILKNQSVFFANIGEIVTKLIQEKEIADLTGGEKKTHQFSQIVSGNLNEQDILFFTTNNFFDYFSLEKTQDILTKNSPSVASKLFLDSLGEQANRLSIAGLILKNEERISVFEQPKQSEEPKLKEPKLEKPKQVKKIKQPKSLETKIQVEKKEVVLPQELLVEKKDFTTLEKPQRKNLRLLIVKLLKKSFCFLGANHLIQRFNKLSLAERILVILSLILAIVFLVGLINLGKKTQNQESFQQYQANLSEVQSKINELKASLIYGDTKKAKELVANIEILLKNLPQKNKSEKQIFQSLSQDLNEQIDKLYHRTNLSELKILVETDKIDAKIKLDSLVLSENNLLYSFDSGAGIIYQVNQEKGNLEKFGQLPVTPTPYFKALSVDKDSLLFLKQNGEASLLNIPLKKFSSANIGSSYQEINIDEAITYAGRLYLLNKKQNQIYKYTKTAAGFGKEEKWLQESVDLNEAISLTADGNLYILKNNGKVIKFYKGKQVPFILEEIWPRLEMPIKILTWYEAKNIYILEPKNERIVIFDKTGKLVQQIYSERFTSLKDFAVNGKETKIWLLDNNQIIEIGL